MKIFRLILILEEDFVRFTNKKGKTTASDVKTYILKSYEASQVCKIENEDIFIEGNYTEEELLDRILYYASISKSSLGKLELYVFSKSNNMETRIFKELLGNKKWNDLLASFDKDFLIEEIVTNSVHKILNRDENEYLFQTKEEVNIAILNSYNIKNQSSAKRK